MTSPRLVQFGFHEFGYAPYHDDESIAYVTLQSRNIAPSIDAIDYLCKTVASHNFSSIVSAAIPGEYVQSFISHDWSVEQSLCVLERSLHSALTIDSNVTTRRANRWDRREVLRLDAKCFEEFWRFDSVLLQEALNATPRHRFRTVANGDLVGYCICGRDSSTAYLQRLAVHPQHRRHQYATILVNDSIQWARRRGAKSMLVNTQQDNTAAMNLYRSLGFVERDQTLFVVSRKLQSNV